MPPKNSLRPNSTHFRAVARAAVLVPALLLFVAQTARAETPEEKGLAIAREADRRDTGFGDYTADQVMVLRNKQKQESRRVMRIKILEGTDDGDRSLIVFDRPRDIDGTALLTFTHKTGDDDLWL